MNTYDPPSSRTPKRSEKAQLPIRSLVPNMMTMLAMCAGLTAIRFALESRWEPAVSAILAAAVLDGLDGRMARLLRSTTRFGAELDSLADVINFGVVPALVLYLWGLEAAGRLGWIAALMYTVCCALRLARFNTALDDPEQAPFVAKYFKGLPTPAAAGLALGPMIATFTFDYKWLINAHVLSVWMVLVAILVISTLPIYSLKRLRLRRVSVLPLLVLGAVAATVTVNYPWQSLIVVTACYVGSIPLSILAYHRDRKAWAARSIGGQDSPDRGVL